MLQTIYGLTFSFLFIYDWGKALEWNNIVYFVFLVVSAFCTIFCLYLNEKFKSTTESIKREITVDQDEKIRTASIDSEGTREKLAILVAAAISERISVLDNRLNQYVRYDIYKNDRESDKTIYEQMQKMMELQFKNINEKLNIILKIREDRTE